MKDYYTLHCILKKKIWNSEYYFQNNVSDSDATNASLISAL